MRGLDISCTTLHCCFFWGYFFAGKDVCVIILLNGGQPVLTLPLTSIPYSGLQVKDFVMLQQAAELEELQLQPLCFGVALPPLRRLLTSLLMRCVCVQAPFVGGEVKWRRWILVQKCTNHLGKLAELLPGSQSFASSLHVCLA